MIPSAVHAGLFAVVSYWAVASLVRATTSLGPRRVNLVSVGVVLASLALFAHAIPGVPTRAGGPVTGLSKFDPEIHAVAEALGGWHARPYALVPVPDDSSWLGVLLPQILPHLRLILSRPLVVEWFLGAEESKRRRKLVSHFYRGTMSERGFRKLRQEFPVDRIIIDDHYGQPARQRALLGRLGWKRRYRGDRYEIWRQESPFDDPGRGRGPTGS
jgi:hypothetical protein